MSHQNNPLSHPSAPVQRRLQGLPAKSKFLAVSTSLGVQQRIPDETRLHPKLIGQITNGRQAIAWLKALLLDKTTELVNQRGRSFGECCRWHRLVAQFVLFPVVSDCNEFVEILGQLPAAARIPWETLASLDME
ncbi:MAG: hypothetical protein OSB55_08310 [Verrucomicrobiota bacterium]|nr:hypothetical protein [Verrucomicrobiota bacterium]